MATPAPEVDVEVDEPWYLVFNDVFWLTLSTSVLAFFGLALRACLKSRCIKIACCSTQGLVACDREPIADENLNMTVLPRTKSTADLSATDVKINVDEGQE
jgi:hypothetical protein